jgi:hypothetical protein
MLARFNQEASTFPMARLAAEGIYRAGRPAEAIAAYDRAAQLAAHERQFEEAFDLGLMAASIAQQSGDAEDAARRYLMLASSEHAGARVAEAHRLGILATADAARKAASGRNRSALLAEYGRLLEEHLARWADSPASDEVRIWLGKWRLETGELAGAQAVVLEIRSESPHYEESNRLLINVFERRLLSTHDPAQQAALANEAAHALQRVITGSENRWPAEWNVLQRDVALALARMQLTYVPEGPAYARQLLTAALASAGEVPEPWRRRASGLLLVAEVFLDIEAGVDSHLREIAEAPRDVKVEVARLLTEPRPAREPGAERRASQLALRILEGVPQPDSRASESSSDYDHARARALAASGQQDAAVSAYRELIARQADDPGIHEEYADLMAASDSPEERRAALALYQEIEQRTNPDGSRWIRARLARIRLLADLGEASEAKKLLKLTAALHPQQAVAQAAQIQALKRELEVGE